MRRGQDEYFIVRMDDPDIIERCLSCEKPRCDNCVMDIAQKKKRRQRTDNLKPVDQLDLAGNYIKTFPSIADAACETGQRRQNIVSCLRGRCKRAGQYRWRYASAN